MGAGYCRSSHTREARLLTATLGGESLRILRRFGRRPVNRSAERSGLLLKLPSWTSAFCTDRTALRRPRPETETSRSIPQPGVKFVHGSQTEWPASLSEVARRLSALNGASPCGAGSQPEQEDWVSSWGGRRMGASWEPACHQARERACPAPRPQRGFGGLGLRRCRRGRRGCVGGGRSPCSSAMAVSARVCSSGEAINGRKQPCSQAPTAARST